MGARALQMKPFSLSDYKTGKSVQRKGVVQRAPPKISSAEEEWNTVNLRDGIDGSNPKAKEDADHVVEGIRGEEEEREAISGDKGVLRDAERARPSDLNEAQISALKLVKLKFNFAGSSEHKWDRGKNPSAQGLVVPDQRVKGNPKPGHVDYKKAEHKSGGEKMVKEKEYLGGKKMVFEYAGPVEALIGGIGEGAMDRGANSTEKNLEDAKQIIIDAIKTFDLIEKNIGERAFYEKVEKNSNVKIDIDIKGFSRGGATASTFAAWIKKAYPENFNVNLLLIDPVDGGRLDYLSLLGAKGAEMKIEVDASGVYDEREKDDEGNDTTGTTLLIPVASNSGVGPALEPQRIKGAQRIILVHGSKSKHAVNGLFKDDRGNPRYFQWNGEKVKGMGLTKLPPGLYGVNSDTKSLDIVRIYADTWLSKYKGLLFGEYLYGEASSMEGRVKAIESEAKELLERKFLKIQTNVF
jgi:hypothetical protein